MKRIVSYDIGEMLRAKRAENNWNGKQLAEWCGTQYDIIKHIEKGKCMASRATAMKIQEHTGVDMEPYRKEREIDCKPMRGFQGDMNTRPCGYARALAICGGDDYLTSSAEPGPRENHTPYWYNGRWVQV